MGKKSNVVFLQEIKYDASIQERIKYILTVGINDRLLA